MKTVLAAKPWIMDPTLVALPWHENGKLDQKLYARRLKIGIMWGDDVVMPHPSVTRALTMMAERLKTWSDVDIVDWESHKHELAWKIIVSLDPLR